MGKKLTLYLKPGTYSPSVTQSYTSSPTSPPSHRHLHYMPNDTGRLPSLLAVSLKFSQNPHRHKGRHTSVRRRSHQPCAASSSTLSPQTQVPAAESHPQPLPFAQSATRYVFALHTRHTLPPDRPAQLCVPPTLRTHLHNLSTPSCFLPFRVCCTAERQWLNEGLNEKKTRSKILGCPRARILRSCRSAPHTCPLASEVWGRRFAVWRRRGAGCPRGQDAITRLLKQWHVGRRGKVVARSWRAWDGAGV